jgi:peptide/nickel transport system substrate-binding protein
MIINTGEINVKKTLVLILLISIITMCITSCELTKGHNKIEYPDPDNKTYRNNYHVMDKGPVKGGTLNLFSTKPDTLNPVLTNNKYVQSFLNFVYESLFRLDKDQKPIPVLVDEWKVSEDGLIWTFVLKDDVFWHDDFPFTAEDVEFTFETILNIGVNTVYKENLQNIVAFAAIDRSTFRVVLNKPNSFMAEMLTFPILPKHCFKDGDISSLTLNIEPIGTGPFKFISATSEAINLTANNKWRDSKNPDENLPNLPYISNIKIKIFESPKDEMSAFQAGDIDVVYVENIDYSKYLERSDIIVKKFVGRDFEFIAFNLKNPILKEQEIRQAIACAIDKKKIIDKIIPGKAIPADLPVIPGTWLYDSNTESSYLNDKRKAKEILLNSGWKEENGVLFKRIKGVKTPLEFELLVNEDNYLRKEISNEISSQLKEIGVRVNVVSLKWEEEFKKIESGKFHMVLMGCSVPSIPDISFLYSEPYLSLSKAANHPATNIAGYFNPDLEKSIKDIFLESNHNRKNAISLNMRSIIREDVPYIGLLFFNNALLCNSNIRGSIAPHVWNKYNDIIRWYISGE